MKTRVFYFVKRIRCTMSTMQITNPAISDTSKPPLVDEHAFFTDGVCWVDG